MSSKMMLIMIIMTKRVKIIYFTHNKVKILAQITNLRITEGAKIKNFVTIIYGLKKEVPVYGIPH